MRKHLFPHKPNMKKQIFLFGFLYLTTIFILAAVIYLFSRPIDLKTKAEILQSLALSSAVLIGGLWATYRFFIQRAYETALEIDVCVTSSTYADDRFLVFFDAVLKNRGQTRISARPRRFAQSQLLPSFEDSAETLYYSFGIKIRRIPKNILNNASLDWFESEYLEPVPGVPSEINLLNEYDYSKNGAVDFWIEPNETYHCGIPLILAGGDYVAKLAFLGNRGGWEFWSRIVHFRVEELGIEVSG